MSLRWRGCLLAALAATSACDPVGEDARAALGPETPGVRPGPLHRPGQPCLVCHDGAVLNPGAFSVAGTIYETPSSSVGLEGVQVVLTDSTGSSPMPLPTTNAAGNFYITPDQWNPVFPLSTISIGFARMWSDIGRNGACASCHVNPAGPASPGQVCIMLDDGGIPP
jgi:hypothetical protein